MMQPRRTGGVCTSPGRGQHFAESFLRFVMFVAVTQVEAVGAFAEDIGAQGHAGATVVIRPGFGGSEELRAGAAAARCFGDDQGVEFGASPDFNEVRNADVGPTDDSCGGGCGNEEGVWPGGLKLAHSSGDFGGRGGIA